MRVPLLMQIDRAYAAEVYRNFVRHYWRDVKLFCGFAEWPPGVDGRQDVDSGPILLGIGSTATAFGLGAAIAADDRPRRDRLSLQLAAGKALLKLFIQMDPDGRGALTMGGVIDPDSSYYTGFLFGDACLFYSTTFADWNRSLKPPADGK